MTTNTPATNAEVLMAAAEAAQNEATASRAVADSLKAEVAANPKDADLAASLVTKEAEAVKDQEAADEALAKALAAENDEKAAAAAIAEPISQSVAESVTTPAVAEKAPTPTAPVAVAKEVKATVSSGTVVSTGKAVAASGSLADTVAKIKESGTVFQRSVINQMEQYIVAMSPGIPMDAIAGARHQTSLWRLIQSIIESNNDEFKVCYALILAYFEEYKDQVFHERYVFRFAEAVSLSSNELATYQQFVNLIKLTSSSATRKQGLRQVDLGRSMKTGVSEKARQNVLEFYKM